MTAKLPVQCLAGLAALALAGCGTPGPVRDLATRTAANVTQVGAHLTTLEATAEGVALARARNVARLKAEVREVRKRHALDIALTRKSGDGGSISLKQDLLDWMKQSRAAARGMTVQELEKAPEEDAVDPVSADVEAVMAGLKSLDPKTKALGTVAKTLAALAKQDDPRAQARFLIGYVKAVRAEVEKKQKEAEAAAKNAKSTAGKAAGSAAADMKQ